MNFSLGKYRPSRLTRLGKSRKEAGFTFVELIAVIGVVTILGFLGLTQIAPIVIEGKVAPGASELRRGMQAMNVSSVGQGATPYAAVTTGMFANMMRGGTIFTTTGAGALATLANNMRLVGQSAVTTAPATLVALGDSYAVTMANVNVSACAPLVNSMKAVSEVITINGTVVKAAGAVLNTLTTTNSCTAGDTNTIIFQQS